MGSSDFLVSINRRKLPCVIEPALALRSAHGPALAQRLAAAFEAWLTRSFWQVLDASDLLARSAGRAIHQAGPLPDPRALDAWITLRNTTDAGAWALRWLGDSVAESQLPEAAQVDLVERYEGLLAALIARVENAQSAARGERFGSHAYCAGLDGMLMAVDSLALSACLDGALILCGGDGAATGDAMQPTTVRALGLAGIATSRIDPGDESNLLLAERTVVRSALAGAGVAPLSQLLPRLAAVHALVDDGTATSEASADCGVDPWQQARAWWYWI